MKARLKQGLGSVLLAILSLKSAAELYEYPYIYRSPRTMGMAGADVAVGGHVTSVFSNPAGLANLPEGWRFIPLGLSAGTTTRTYDFLMDLDSALSQPDEDEQRQALFALIDDYRGRNIHGQASMVSSLSWRGRYRGQEIATTLSYLNSQRFDARAHQGFGGDGLISVHARRLNGLVFGAAWKTGDWSLGLAAKNLRRNRLEEDYSPRELVEIAQADDRTFTDDFTNGSDNAFDLGLQYRFSLPAIGPGRFGLAVQNLGDLDFGEAGTFPQTTTLGVSLQPPAPAFTRLTLSAEYIDLFHRYPSDEDPIKRTKLGLRWHLFERGRTNLSYSLGLYQGSPTAGIELQTRYAEFSAATYAEEQGAYAGQDQERRYIVGVSLGL